MNNQCSVYAQVDEFSSTPLNCKHPTIGGVPINRPEPFRKPDFRSNIQPSDHNYLRFSLPCATDSLNLRTQARNEVSVFPRNIYALNPFANSVSNLIQPRDRNIHYIYNVPGDPPKERDTHSEWQSRFGYDRFPNEYGLGVQSRGYVEPFSCHCDHPDVPTGTACARFYTAEHLDHTPTELQKAVRESRYHSFFP